MGGAKEVNGEQFQTETSGLSLSLQTKQLLCTPKTQERTSHPHNYQSRAGTFSAFFVLL